MAVTLVGDSSCWPCTSGFAQALTKAFIPGVGTQCDSRAGRPAAATRPRASSTCTVLALQRLQMPGMVSKALAKRASRTVKYCAPWSNVPNALLRVAMRPPKPALFSSTVTLCPACASVRAQVMPAMPAPITAKFLESGAVRGRARALGMRGFSKGCDMPRTIRPGVATKGRPVWQDFPVFAATNATRARCLTCQRLARHSRVAPSVLAAALF